jgi:hypothetical protein
MRLGRRLGHMEQDGSAAPHSPIPSVVAGGGGGLGLFSHLSAPWPGRRSGRADPRLDLVGPGTAELEREDEDRARHMTLAI